MYLNEDFGFSMHYHITPSECLRIGNDRSPFLSYGLAFFALLIHRPIRLSKVTLAGTPSADKALNPHESRKDRLELVAFTIKKQTKRFRKHPLCQSSVSLQMAFLLVASTPFPSNPQQLPTRSSRS